MTTPKIILLLTILTKSSVKAMIRGYHSKLLGKNYHAMIRGYHSKLLGKNYHAQEYQTDSENQFVVAVTKGKTIQVSHTCTCSKALQVRDWCRSGFRIKLHHLLAFFYYEVGRSSVKLLDTGSIHKKMFIISLRNFLL